MLTHQGFTNSALSYQAEVEAAETSWSNALTRAKCHVGMYRTLLINRELDN